MSTLSHRNRQNFWSEQKQQRQPSVSRVAASDEPIGNESSISKPQSKPADVNGEFITPGGCNTPDPELDWYSWCSAMPSSTTVEIDMRDAFNGIPFREYVHNRIIPNLSDKVLRNTHPLPLLEKPAQFRSQYTSRYDFLAQGQKYEWKPFKAHPDIRTAYAGPAFPESTGGWMSNEWQDFRKSVFECWNGHDYPPEELEYVAEKLWKRKIKLGKSYWIQFKLPLGMILENKPPDEQAEELG